MKDFKNIKKIHFVGIGGIGISGLAKYLLAQGFEVSGSDIAHNIHTRYLESLGVKISVPHDKNAISGQDVVIHSAIIRAENIELLEAKKQNIAILSRKEALEFILKDRVIIAVCGAHGKSTTSAILSALLPDFGAIIGADSKEFGSNVRESASKFIVFEADESDKSFLNSNPKYAIVPNAEPEHMESYNHNLDEFYAAYSAFLDMAEFRILNAEDAFLASKISAPNTISLHPKTQIKNVKFMLKNDAPHTCFVLENGGENLGEFCVFGFGEHMAINASLALLASVQIMKTEFNKERAESLEILRKNLLNFKGIKKRFDIIFSSPKTTIIDDYAHHPTEISATLKSAKIYADMTHKNKVVAIWQPHKFSRLLDNLEAFKTCFANLCDELVILPVWAAGEAFVEVDFLSHFAAYNPILADRVKKVDEAVLLLKNDSIIQRLENALIIGLGAGDITYQIRGEK